VNVAQFDIAEAKARFSELIEKVVLGEEIIVAKDNEPVAKIVPLRPVRRRPGRSCTHGPAIVPVISVSNATRRLYCGVLDRVKIRVSKWAVRPRV
jgi:prevent-host-death family protein